MRVTSALAVAIAVAALASSRAEAGSAGAFVRAGAPAGRAESIASTVIPAPPSIFRPLTSTVAVRPRTDVVPHRVFVVAPPVVYVLAPYASLVVADASPYIAQTQCTTPGSWSYTWVPQQYPYNEWVPGHFSEDGYWIDGRYETRVYGSGYWQPFWVGGDC